MADTLQQLLDGREQDQRPLPLFVSKQKEGRSCRSIFIMVNGTCKGCAVLRLHMFVPTGLKTGAKEKRGAPGYTPLKLKLL